MMSSVIFAPAAKTVPNQILFTGEYQDLDGLIYLRARYYDPADGRFLTSDTVFGDLTNPLTQNRYVYCNNNPVIYVDPSGHITRTICSDLQQMNDVFYTPSPGKKKAVTYREGSSFYVNRDGKIYKNGVLVPKKNYRYVPSCIGGTRESYMVNRTRAIRNAVESTADVVIGKAVVDKLKDTKSSNTKIPKLGPAAEVVTETVRPGIKIVKNVSKLAGPVAIASYSYDLSEISKIILEMNDGVLWVLLQVEQ